MNSQASASPLSGTPEMVQLDPSNPWRPLLIPVAVVIIGLAIAWALFAHFGVAKPDASATILREAVFPVQVDAEVSQIDAGMPGAAAPQNEMIVLVQARLTNIGPKPLTIFDMVEDEKLDGARNESSAALPEDIDRLIARFPNLASMRMPPLTRHQVIAPGQSVEGLMVFNYAWSPAQWQQRQNSRLVISFQNGRSLILPLQ